MTFTGKTLFGKPIVEVENLLPEPVGEIVLVSLDAWMEARKKAIADEADRCPKCGGREIMSTCVGILTGPDTNAATCCECGWTGEVWQLDPIAQIAEIRARKELAEAAADAPEPCEHGIVGVGDIHAERLNDAVRVTQHFACKGGCPPESKWGKGMKGVAVVYDDRLTEPCEASP